MAAVVASLVFVGLQIKQSDEIALVELRDNAAIRNLELNTLRADHADIWQKTCLGDELSSSEKVIASSIYFAYISNNWNAWVRHMTTGYGLAESDYLIDTVAANIHRYPGLKKTAMSYRDWRTNNSELDSMYTPMYQEAIRSRLSELEQLESNPEYDVMRCGHQYGCVQPLLNQYDETGERSCHKDNDKEDCSEYPLDADQLTTTGTFNVRNNQLGNRNRFVATIRAFPIQRSCTCILECLLWFTSSR